MREDFLKNYLGSELDPLWLETVSKLTAKGWKNFVARDKDRIKELRAQIRTLVTDTGLDAARTLVATEQARPSRRRESFRFFNCVAWRWCGDDSAKPSSAPKTMRITMSRTRFDQFDGCSAAISAGHKRMAGERRRSLGNGMAAHFGNPLTVCEPCGDLATLFASPLPRF